MHDMTPERERVCACALLTDTGSEACGSVDLNIVIAAVDSCCPFRPAWYLLPTPSSAPKAVGRSV